MRRVCGGKLELNRSATSKLTVFFLLLILSCQALAFLPVNADSTITTTQGFEALSYTKTLYAVDITYPPCWNASTGSVWPLTHWNVGGQINSSGYEIWKTYLFFDLSRVPYEATVNTAILSLYINSDNSTTDFNVTLQHGSGYPHIPVLSTDFWQGRYSGNGGNRSTGDALTAAAWWNITLTSEGLGWFTYDTTTSFVLRSSNDINATAPSGSEYIIFDSYGTPYPPVLYVTYTYSASYTLVTRGPYYEGGGVAPVNVSITLYRQYEAPETRLLNGSGGIEDVETWYAAFQPFYFVWNISDPTLNESRVYWLMNQSFENVYVFVPDAASIHQRVTYTLNDIYGISNAYLELHLQVDGYDRIVERNKASVTAPFTFWTMQFHSYGQVLISDQGTVDFGSSDPSNTAPTLQVTRFSFPIQYNYYNVQVTALRLNGTCVTVYYNDSDATTSTGSVALRLNHTTATFYSSSWMGNSYTLTLNTLGSTTDYNCQIIGNRTDNDYVWNIPLPAPLNGTSIWAGLDVMFPDFYTTTGMHLANAFGIFIILCIFAVFSFWHTGLAAFLAVLTNAIMLAIGWMEWLPSTGTILTVSFIIVILMAIKRGRRGETD